MATPKPVLQQIWASTGSRVYPSSTQQNNGWNGSLPPVSTYFNAKYNEWDSFNHHVNEQGIAVWDTATDYPVNGLAKGSDGVVYKSIVSNNQNNNPTLTPTAWVPFLENFSATVEFSPGSIQTIPASSIAVIKYNTVLSDTHTWWDPINFWFKPTISGNFVLRWCAYCDNSNGSVYSTLLKDGSPIQDSSREVTAGNDSLVGDSYTATGIAHTTVFQVQYHNVSPSPVDIGHQPYRSNFQIWYNGR